MEFREIAEIEEIIRDKAADEELMVSVLCLTYNHKEYIKDALDGFINQKTNFSYEIVVFDDASTDGTSDILRDYAKKYPKMISVYIAHKNTYRHPDRGRMYVKFKIESLKGKYIASCEGDDFWIDNNKLQIQVDYLEKHDDCVMYLHNCIWHDYLNDTILPGDPYECCREKDLTAEEIIMQYNRNPPTASTIYRKGLIFDKDFYYNSPVGDYTLQLFAMSKGKLHYCDRIMSVYRWNTNGSYGQRMRTDTNIRFYHRLSIINFLLKFDQETSYRYHCWILGRVQLYVNAIISEKDEISNLKERMNICRASGYNLPDIYDCVVDKLEDIRIRYIDTQIVSEELIEFIKLHKYNIIMGAGDYSYKLTEQLKKHQINIDGYVVSKKDGNESSYQNKPLWTFDEIPYEKGSFGLVVAINLRDSKLIMEICRTLKSADISSVYFPFCL